MKGAVVFLLLLTAATADVATNYLVGAGIWDVTGPAAEINMMGYANPSQRTNGIHLRQYSRAYVIADEYDFSRTVFVSVDACMISTLVKAQVIKQLKVLYKDLYNESNVCISGIHTHSGPGGFHEYVLLDVTSLGFVKQSMQALADGIAKSIIQAHERMQPANLYVAHGDLFDANINRSPTAYLNNPAEERARYNNDTDTKMTVVKIVGQNMEDIGMISWFPVHCTSMNNTNGLISSDNKGVASQLMETDMNPGMLPNEVRFIAAFAQANEGDVSPNTKGPHCMDTGLPCDVKHSTCNGKNELCVASGPGKDMFESTKIIGTKQYEKAKELYAAANVTGMKLSGGVGYRHQYVQMSSMQFPLQNGTKVTTCPSAMGYSFAAGTTDGPGAFDFTQGTNSTNKFWSFVSQFISKPSKYQVACQHPKPILLNTGEVSFPYAWQPEIQPVQLLAIGELVIAGIPGEFTTMAGRRLRERVTEMLVSSGFPKDTEVVLAGLSNAYGDYITTFEEYQVQRYEGASTVYGPHTLEAYIYKLEKLAYAMAKGKVVEPGPSPPDLLSKQLSFVLPVVYDSTPTGAKFGQPITDAKAQYMQTDAVQVTFNSADPRNNLMTMKSFLDVERRLSNGTWVTYMTDAHWDTRFQWVRTGEVTGRSSAVCTWQIAANTPDGMYRIRHSGYYKPLFSNPKPFTGTSRVFGVGKTYARIGLARKHNRVFV